MAKNTLNFIPIIPRKMKVRQYRKAVENALDLEGNSIESLYKQVSNTFSTPVDYKKTKLKKGNMLGIRVATSDKRMVNLDKGTNTRWAVMSSDFRPKTRVGSLQARGGAGRTVIRGRRAMTARNIRPRPGIKARGFSEEVVNQRERDFPARVQRSIDIAAEDTY